MRRRSPPGRLSLSRTAARAATAAAVAAGWAASLIDDEWKFGSDDETLVRLIKGEIAEATMPKVYGSLPDEEIWKMLAFIRTLYKGDPSKINW